MKRVFLAGSRKFSNELEDVARLCGQACISISKGRDVDATDVEHEKETHQQMFHRIDDSDIVYVIAKDGYVGQTVTLEVGYAYAKKKEIIATEPISEVGANSLISRIMKAYELINYVKQSPITEDANGRRIEISKDHVQRSYETGHFVEAIILTHIVIGIWMNMTFGIVCNLISPLGRIEKMRVTPKEKMYSITTYDYILMAEILCDMGIYKGELYIKLKNFNTYRNSIAHKLFQDIPNKEELDRYFKLGMELWVETWDIVKVHNKNFSESMEKLLEGSKNEKS